MTGGNATTIPSLSEKKAPGFLARLKQPALWAAVLMVLLIIIFRFFNIRTSTDPQFLALFLNIIFIFIPSVIVTVMAIRSFINTGAWPVIWLGTGAFTYGITMLLSVVFLGWADVSENSAIAMHDMGILTTAVLHLVGAFFAINQVPPKDNEKGRRPVIFQLFATSLVWIIFVSYESIADSLPPFFNPGIGGTGLQSMLLATTSAIFVMAGLMFLRQYLRSRSFLLYWYSLGLFLLASGVLGIMMQTAMGTPLNWISRTAQYLGGLYLLAAAFVAVAEAKAKHITTDESLAALLSATKARLKETEEKFEELVRTAPAGIYEMDFWENKFVSVNDVMCEILGYSREELLKTDPLAILDQDGKKLFRIRLLTWLEGKESDKNTEFRIRKKDGSMIYALLNIKYTKDEAGRPKKALVIINDITESKKSEKEIQDLMKSLQLEKDKLQTLVNSIPESVWFVNADGKLELVNQTVIDETDVVSSNAEDIEKIASTYTVLRADGSPSARSISPPARALRGEFVRNEEETVILPDGRVKVRQVSASPVRDADGNIIGSVAIARDITERKKSDDALRESENRFSTIFEKAAFPLTIAEYDGFQFVSVNEKWLKTFGFTKEEVIGKTGGDLGTNRNTVRDEINLGKLRQEGEARGFEDTLYTKSGEPLIFSINTDIVVINGKKYWLTSLFDITERKKAENALKESEEKFNKAFAYSPIGIGIADDKGHSVEANDAWLQILGYSREEFIGHDSFELQTFADPKEQQRIIELLNKDSEAINQESVFRKKNGDLITMSYSIVRIILAGKEHFISTMVDITERKKAEEIKDEFIGMVSHELRTPLTLVKGAIKVAMNTDLNMEEVRDLLKDADYGVDSLTRLLDNLLELSRYQANRLKLEKESVNIEPVILKAVYQKNP